ncbi:HesB/IscA family protein [Marinagarivorans cellulosilyticus]|uniref:Iron-sulfur cluster assembly protein n=1 Tax=Marinagarivorans cellulosilyticus TaxID=2721545 RepID=A0AAN2BJ44_9GAMM|nr:iron-sulfur cluster assembly accessory protein [Marinagarivorans cellulosilyticus]BCD96588.1 iron-sulfur cluster assembly protein [Marinagarivorans cellulosilyticus]
MTEPSNTSTAVPVTSPAAGVQSFSSADVLTVTETAAEHFARVLAKSGKKAIRVTLKEAGCTGFKYVIDEVDEQESGDIKKSLPNGTALYIDPKHIGALQGTVIDFTIQGVNKNLVINNPNVKDACGCGESFSV